MHQDIKRSVLLLAVLVVIAVIMRWTLSHGKTERLFDVPVDGEARMLGIRGDDVLFLSILPSGVELSATSIQHKTTRIVGSDPELTATAPMVLTDTDLYFKIPPPGVPTISAPGVTGISPTLVPGGPGSSPIPVGSDTVRPMPMISGPMPGSPSRTARSQSASAPPAGPVARPNPPTPLQGAGDQPGGPVWNGDAPPARVRRLALTDGHAEEIEVPLARRPGTQRNFAVLGDKVYFTRFEPAPPPPHTAPLARRKTSFVTLYSCSVSGSAEQRVRRVPGILSSLYASRARLYWIVARPDEPTRVDLYHMDRGSDQIDVVRDYESWSPPASTSDRLYWITRKFVRRNPRMAAVTLMESSLVSAHYDGTDRSEIAKLIAGGQDVQAVGRPLVHKDRVYVQVSERDEGHPGMSRSEALFRVRNDLRGLERVTTIPKNTSGGGFVEDGWYYFIVSDRRQGWLDYLRDGPEVQMVDVLHRYKLPD